MSLREAAQAAITTLEYAAEVADRPGLMDMCEKAAELLRTALAEAEEPVAWAGYNLDRMAEAFGLVIDAYDDKNEFQSPIVLDADLALREFRTIIRRVKAYKHPPSREPLTVEAIDALTERVEFLFGFSDDWAVHFARAIERAHGIGGDE